MRGTIIAVLFASLLLTTTTAATEAQVAPSPRKLDWKDLLPPAAQKAKPFWLPRRRAADDDLPPPPPTEEGRWLSRRTDRTAVNGDVVTTLDGQHVVLGGYVVPLDFDTTQVVEFLLVPFVGACIHVPPPPPNQIVLVRATKPFAVSGPFDPVYVTGTIKVSAAKTDLADVGYAIEAQSVEMRQRPDAGPDGARE